MARDDRGPHCPYCATKDVTVESYTPATTERREIGRAWQAGSIERNMPVPPEVDYTCNRCGRSGTVTVGYDWEPPDSS